MLSSLLCEPDWLAEPEKRFRFQIFLSARFVRNRTAARYPEAYQQDRPAWPRRFDPQGEPWFSPRLNDHRKKPRGDLRTEEIEPARILTPRRIAVIEPPACDLLKLDSRRLDHSSTRRPVSARLNRPRRWFLRV